MNGGPYIECAACGDRIHSANRHDFRTCRCKATFVDGGSSYLRVGGHPVFDGDRIKTWPSVTPSTPLTQEDPET